MDGSFLVKKSEMRTDQIKHRTLLRNMIFLNNLRRCSILVDKSQKSSLVAAATEERKDNNEKGYLTDTSLTAQYKYKGYLDYFRIQY